MKTQTQQAKYEYKYVLQLGLGIQDIVRAVVAKVKFPSLPCMRILVLVCMRGGERLAVRPMCTCGGSTSFFGLAIASKVLGKERKSVKEQTRESLSVQ